ncbi:radical SAM protein [Nocardiopsis synnemataformans]|uniref:radical SAM protein n=1 Tax=Nocardiopsis synnemataformans TaxID=61305 RepID=UPI003EBE6BA5
MAKTPGLLSHFSPHDLPTREVMVLARTLKGSAVGRVFVAGGEPLMWRLVLDLIKILKDGGIEVVVCTSGVALNQPGMSERLVELGVKGVSVSLDSTDPDYNDTWRPPRREGDGWEGVVRGITTLLAARGSSPRSRVGLYTVITKLNLSDVTAVPQPSARAAPWSPRRGWRRSLRPGTIPRCSAVLSWRAPGSANRPWPGAGGRDARFHGGAVP